METGVAGHASDKQAQGRKSEKEYNQNITGEKLSSEYGCLHTDNKCSCNPPFRQNVVEIGVHRKQNESGWVISSLQSFVLFGFPWTFLLIFISMLGIS